MDKASRAENLLRDDFFQEEVEIMRKLCLEKIVNSRQDDYEEREQAYRQIKAIDEFVAHFHSLAAQKAIDAKRWKIL
jgi:hypothetical protein